MDIADYLGALRRRWRIVLACVLLGAVVAGVVTIATTPRYEAQAQLFVSTRQAESDTDLFSGGSFSQQRVKSYAEVVTTPRVLAPAIAELGLRTDPETLAGEITVQAPLDTVLVNISVRDADPARSAAIANAVGRSFIRVVTALEATSNSDDPRSPVAVSFVRRAVTPGAAVSPSVPANLGIGLLAGLVLGVLLALLRNATDTRVRDRGDLGRDGAVVLGEIPFDRAAISAPILLRRPHGARAEAFRTLRTNLNFADAVGKLDSVVVTSSAAAEGKSTTVANLALAMMDSGLRVAIVDADLRKPRMAHYLGLVNTVGLTTVLLGRIPLAAALQRWGGTGLHVLTAGDTPPNPSELLGSSAMVDVLRALEQDFDLVIIDSPPALPVTDAVLLAARASGALLVTAAGRARAEEVDRALEALQKVGARVVGTVLNLARSAPSGYRYEESGHRAGWLSRRLADPTGQADPVEAPETRTAREPAESSAK